VSTRLLSPLSRTFTRDAKSIQEREQALKLLRVVIVLPDLPQRRFPSPYQSRNDSRQNHFRQNTADSGSGHPRAPSSGGTGHARRLSPGRSSRSRQPSTADIDPVSILIARKVPLTDGMVRCLVSSAENAEDPLRTICMETLVEIGLFLYRAGLTIHRGSGFGVFNTV
jgi:rapamycin-insensitive companion of mTOR